MLQCKSNVDRLSCSAALSQDCTPSSRENERKRKGQFRVAKKGENGGDKPVIKIKKYANRRLYNTATSSYVTLDHLCQMVKEDVDFVVEDAKTGEDITRNVLTQIIVEEESKGQNLLPISFLRQLIGFYGHGMQSVVPTYLEQMMEAFAQNQERMASYMQNAMGGMFPFGNLGDMNKQNMEMLEATMKMFTPFGAEGEEAKKATGAGEAQSKENLEELKRQVDLLQKQLQTLTDKDS